MIQKLLTNSTILSLVIILSSCSLLPSKQIEVVSKPMQIDIIHPEMPRAVSLGVPRLYVVSEAVIANPCKATLSFDPKKFNEDGSEKLKRPKACAKEDTENPDWPDGYTYLDRFLDDMKELNNGEVVFVATTIGDYKVMAEDMQELKRYIKQLGEVVIYYRNVTLPNGEKGVGVSVEKKGD